MRLKGKPSKPKRKIVYETYPAYDGTTLQNIVDFFLGNDFSQVYIDIDKDCDYGGYCDVTPYFRLKRPETDEEFAVRMETYKKRLATYEEWYKENEEDIKEEKKKRAIAAKEKMLKETAKEKSRLEKMKKNLEKQLKKLET